VTSDRRGGGPPAGRPRSRGGLLVVAGLAVLVVLGVAGYALVSRGQGTDLAATWHPNTPQASTNGNGPAPTATPTPTPTAVPSYAASGPGTYQYASGTGQVVGTAGALRQYRVAIETGTPVAADEFARMVDATLGDPRSWIAGKDVRLQRVSEQAASQFTVYLVTPGTAKKLCAAGNLDIVWHGEPYTSCRVGNKVVINIARFLTSVPHYGAPLSDYQQYAINHEVGHALGHEHELCPAPGKPAPVMQQQTFDLQGCVANSWPYLDGKRYAGPPGRIVPSD
jgi:hypothetical protein